MGQPAAAMDYDSDGGVFWRPRASPSHLHLPDGRRFPPSFRSPHWPELAARQHHMQREMQREVQREMQKQLQRELQHPGFHGVYPTLYDALMQKLMGHKGMAFGDGLGAGLGGSGLGGAGFGGGGLRGSGLDRGSHLHGPVRPLGDLLGHRLHRRARRRLRPGARTARTPVSMLGGGARDAGHAGCRDAGKSPVDGSVPAQHGGAGGVSLSAR